MINKERVIPESVEVIAFDWDGTVIDTVPYKLRQNQVIAHEFGNMLTIEEVRREWNEAAGFPDLLRRLTGGADMDLAMEVVQRDYNNPLYAKREFDFAKPTLNSLRAQGLRTAILTNLTRELLEHDAADLNFTLEDYFDYIQPVDAYKYKKPDGRVFTPLLQHFTLTAEKLLYVGDEMKDYRAAASAGAHFIGVATGMSSAEEFHARGAVFLSSIGELV